MPFRLCYQRCELKFPACIEIHGCMFRLELTRPHCLLLAIPMGVVLGLWFVRSLSSFPRRQQIFSLVTRGCMATLLILSLSGLTWLGQTREQFVLFVVDQSQSIGENARTFVTAFLRATERQRGRHAVAYLPFATRPGTVQFTPFDTSIPLFRQGLAESQGSAAERSRQSSFANAVTDDESLSMATNLATAIDAAAGYLPSGYVSHVVLLTDGNQTEGDAASAAARSPVPITTVMLPGRNEPEIHVTGIQVPSEVRAGEPFFIDVSIFSNHDDEGLVEVFRGDHRIAGEKQTLKAGENRFRFEQSIEHDRMTVFRARISEVRQDTLLDNNAESALVFTEGRPRVLIVESDPNLIREMAYALEDEGIQADVRPPSGLPQNLDGLQGYELLILSNVPATSLTQQQMDMIRIYVQELGGGFLMLGGEQSFGLGGYYRSTLEEVLPVRSDFEKEKEKPSLGMVLVIDRSGSMQGDPLEMAKTAARSAVELLSSRDQVAVLAFDDQTYVISEMQSASNIGRISDEISRIESGGGTSLFPAMQMAYEILSATNAKLRHIIVLTDGQSNPGDFEGLTQRIATARMTVSTVALGGADTEMLQKIARLGKGRYYLAEDPSQVPRIFARETVTASKSAIDEQPFLPQVIRTTRALAELDLESAPFLLGYVTTQPKPTSEVILATEKGDPLLAWWRYGLGMSAAFTSDAKSRWAAEWLTWPGYGKFWTQVVRQIMRKTESKGLQTSLHRHGGHTEVVLDAADDRGVFLNGAAAELTLIDPRLRRSRVTMHQTAPGRYSTSFASAQPGAYHLEIALTQNGEVRSRQSRGLIAGYPDELRIRPPNESLLREIALVSGGQFNPSPEFVFDRQDETATRYRPLWPWLLFASGLLLVLDVALRRVEFSLLLPGKWLAVRSVRPGK
jgi:Ca-activated chloride channel family protein